MSEFLRVEWTITPSTPPRPVLPCRRCATASPFASSGKFRLNANGRRLDAWLIYKCPNCDETWNRPIVERCDVRRLDPALLAAFQINDPAHARRVAFDVESLRRHAARVEMGDGADIVRGGVPRAEMAGRRIEIRLTVTLPTALRLDRLLSRELGLARPRFAVLEREGRLAVLPGGARALRRPVRDGTIVRIDLTAGAGS